MSFKNRVVQAVVAGAASRGYVIVPEWRVDAQPMARHLKALFALQSIDCVLDVGANMGQYHDFIRNEVGFDGLIISFEPVSKYVQMLKKRLAEDEKWILVEHALGSADAEAEINVTTSPGLNSFLEPRREDMPGFWDGEQAIRKEIVQIRTLDAVYPGLVEKYRFRAPYLKLDTQGFDLEVVRGARATLPGVRALQTEASVRPIYESMPGYTQTIATMNAEGFQLSAMFPVSHDDALRLVEFDCVMVR
jgi:FkbM family methyltransferase